MTANQLEIRENGFGGSSKFRIKRAHIFKEFGKAFFLGAALCLLMILLSL
ncbi:hypothetical protein [Emcibacter sp.]|nr:hypothetical protein [Emcibacter sp.]